MEIKFEETADLLIHDNMSTCISKFTFAFVKKKKKTFIYNLFILKGN